MVPTFLMSDCIFSSKASENLCWHLLGCGKLLLSAVASSAAACCNTSSVKTSLGIIASLLCVHMIYFFGHPDLCSGLTIITIQNTHFGHLLSKIIPIVGMLFLSRQNKKGGIRYGINRSTEQKLQRGLHHIRWRKETAEMGDLSFL